MSETNNAGSPQFEIGARDRLSLTSQTTQITDFDGDVMITNRAWGDQLRSVDGVRLFALALIAASGATAGVIGGIGVAKAFANLMERILG